MSVIDKFIKTKHLPLGHYDKEKAAQNLSKEYQACKAIETKWRKRFKINSLTKNQALIHCNQICDLLGQRPIKKIVTASEQIKEGVGAHYSGKEIHFQSDWISVTTLIHELTHHFNCHNHGPEFCDIENFLFRVSYELLMNKKPKQDW